MVRRRGGPKVAFNRLRAPGHGDVRDRIEAVYAAVDALGAEDLNLTPAPVFDHDDRAARIEELEARAADAGRTETLDAARDRLKDALVKRWTSRLTLAYGMESIQTGRVEDRAAIVTALRDLVAAAVMRDLLADDDVMALAEPGLRIVGAADFDELDAMTTVADDDALDDEAVEGLDDADDGPGPDADDDPLGLGADPGAGRAADERAQADVGGVPEVVRERIVRGADARPGAPTADDWRAADAEARSRDTGFRPNPVAVLVGALAIVGMLAVLSVRVERTSVVSGLVLVALLLAGVFVVFRLASRRRG